RRAARRRRRRAAPVGCGADGVPLSPRTAGSARVMTGAFGHPASRLQRTIWLTTMVYLLALLGTIFVMTLAPSQRRLRSCGARASSLQSRFTDAAEPILIPPEQAAPRRLAPRAVDLDYLHRLLVDKAAAHTAL